MSIFDLDKDLWLCIPTDGRSFHLQDIARNSGIETQRRLLIRTDDGSEIPNYINLRAKNRGEVNIQSWWNQGIDFCWSNNGRYLAILSDDVEIEAGQLQVMLNELIAEEAILNRSKNSNGGFWGHAFILDLSSGIRADERFFWAWGDFDIMKQSRKLGRVITSATEVKHLTPNLRTAKSADLQALAKLDTKTYSKKYPLSFLLWKAEQTKVLLKLSKILRDLVKKVGVLL